jgi:hypothetical protein
LFEIEIVSRWRVASSDRIAAEPSGGVKGDVLSFFVTMFKDITLRCLLICT